MVRECGFGFVRYMLKIFLKYESYDIVKYCNFVYSFGIRFKLIKVFNSFGLCYFLIEGVNCYGMNGSFKYFMLGDGNWVKMMKFIIFGLGRRKLFGNLWLLGLLKCKYFIYWV